MYISASLLTILLPLAALPSAQAQDSAEAIYRAEVGLSVLQRYYNGTTGMWTGWWNSANVMNIVANLAKLDPNPQLLDLAGRIFANTALVGPAQNFDPGAEEPLKKGKRRAASGYTKGYDKNGIPYTTYPDSNNIDKMKRETVTPRQNGPKYDPHAWLDGFYDDDLWWALAFIAAYDVTKDVEYLKLGEGIFNAVSRVWPSSCGGGGIYWNNKKDVVNAIPNELFFSTAAHLANRAEDKNKYADWAVKAIDWFVASGMINEQGLINDGLTAAPECKNNGLQTWSYNQGVILGGLAELYKSRPADAYRDLANKLAKASIKLIADDKGIIHDPCGPLCGGDASQFKGIYMRGLQAVNEVFPDPAYVASIKANAESVWNNDRDTTSNLLSIDWAGPYIENANATTHSSAMEALIAAISVSK